MDIIHVDEALDQKTSQEGNGLLQQLEKFVLAAVEKRFAIIDAKIDSVLKDVNKLDETTSAELKEIRSLLMINHGRNEQQQVSQQTQTSAPESPRTPESLRQASFFTFDSGKIASPTHSTQNLTSRLKQTPASTRRSSSPSSAKHLLEEVPESPEVLGQPSPFTFDSAEKTSAAQFAHDILTRAKQHTIFSSSSNSSSSPFSPGPLQEEQQKATESPQTPELLGQPSPFTFDSNEKTSATQFAFDSETLANQMPADTQLSSSSGVISAPSTPKSLQDDQISSTCTTPKSPQSPVLLGQPSPFTFDDSAKKASTEDAQEPLFELPDNITFDESIAVEVEEYQEDDTYDAQQFDCVASMNETEPLIDEPEIEEETVNNTEAEKEDAAQQFADTQPLEESVNNTEGKTEIYNKDDVKQVDRVASIDETEPLNDDTQPLEESVNNTEAKTENNKVDVQQVDRVASIDETEPLNGDTQPLEESVINTEAKTENNKFDVQQVDRVASIDETEPLNDDTQPLKESVDNTEAKTENNKDAAQQFDHVISNDKTASHLENTHPEEKTLNNAKAEEDEIEKILFKAECRLYSYQPRTGEPKKKSVELGRGDIFITHNLANQYYQVHMQRNSDQTICADFTIRENSVVYDNTQNKNCGWIKYDEKCDGEMKEKQFIIRFREKTSYDNFKQIYNDAVEKIGCFAKDVSES